MADLVPQQSLIGGKLLDWANATATTGDTFPTGSYALLIRNASGSAITATVTTPGLDKYGQARPDIQSVSVPATTGIVSVGPFPRDLGDPAADDEVKVVCSAVTTVTLALLAI